MSRAFLSLILGLILKLTLAKAPSHVLFLISSQDTNYHRILSENLRKDIIKQSHSISPDYVINVRLFDEILNHPGDWTLLTMLPQLTANKSLINENTKWIIVCEETTKIRVAPLLQRLHQENHTQLSYLGYPLFDQEATIIHHFAFYENPQWFEYPMLRSGVIFSSTLLHRLAVLAAHQGVSQRHYRQHSEFSIDASHELARFILDNVVLHEEELLVEDHQQQQHCSKKDAIAKGNNNISRSNQSKELTPSNNSNESIPKDDSSRENSKNVQKIILKRASYICPAVAASDSEQQNECLMYAKPADMATCLPVNREQVYFAIKTCQRFRQERLPHIEATWASYAVHKRYFSDVEDADAEIQTISVNVPNVEVGHCAKTLEILKLALKDIRRINGNIERHEEGIHWIFICDDDTLLSVAGVCEVLGCFDPEQQIYLGERYGYRLHAPDGFNYITGGGGIVLSLSLAELIVQQCSCPSANSPDDMILGACLNALQIKAIHSSRFHQARPLDYAPELLALEAPISFHKFWQLDPLDVYEQWFAKADRSKYSRYHHESKSQIQLRTHPNKSKIYNKVNRNFNRFDEGNQHRSEVRSSTELIPFHDFSAFLSGAKEAKHMDL